MKCAFCNRPMLSAAVFVGALPIGPTCARKAGLDYVMAWCAQNGVELRDARQWVDEETGEIMGGVQ